MAARKPTSPPIEVHARPGLPLGMTPAVFLRDFWQKRPLLIRNAFGDFQTPVQPEDLAGLACEEGVLARLIRHDRATDGWSVRTGPFEESDFPGLPEHDWTLLVQDVDKWDPDVRALVDQFAFLPRWRMDDVMISFAATGGSVGAHVDQYDVFLLQAHGHRRWQIDASESTKGKRPPLGFRPDVELKLLKVFKPTHDWVLAPGDMLYLPPNVPHNGVAEDPCLTFSFGMRAPSSAELISDYLDTLIADADENIRYQDPDLKVPADPNEIDTVSMGRVITALNAIRMNDPDKLGDWFGRFITTYRAAGEVMAHQATPPQEEVAAALQAGLLLQRHPWARLAWRRAKRGASLYVSGQDFALSVKDAQRLAAAEQLDDTGYRGLSDKGRAVVQQLLAGGVFQLLDPADLSGFDDEEPALGEVVEGIEQVDAIDEDAVSDDVHTVTVHDDGIEVIVSFDDEDELDDDGSAGPGPPLIMAAFQVQVVSHGQAHAALHGVRQQVFVVEQGVPADLERDALDPVCTHVLAVDGHGQAIGTGRMAPDGRIGRMAVLADWRGQRVGEALLEALVQAAGRLGLAEVHLHAQLPARDFYARQGFLPEGPEFHEAGIAHQQMHRALRAASAIDGLAAAVAATTAIIHRARRRLWIHSRQLDPGLLDASPVQAALRRFATQAHDKQLRVIVHDAAAVAAAGAPLLALAQRLPSVVQFREVSDPVDRALASACFLNDAGDYYFRLIGLRVDGEAGIALPARSQPFELQLQRVWDRSRDCSELRALGF